ncbi:NAD-dependent epimerase/dehydratase family protein [Streptomyces sp. A7024]|uniref:NAD-dependent epimerase/dehydratase family protein n=1 Tax=Streptomyces coryli TaxID=1128680 RepID=A0A6G4UDZ7_9ACTN|nr:NAD-dependent epimerase/dehydratase family protein [Streptomyces coryli]NGN69940.1 NAD-dependent epimerase/dehydratase family protein [Streptomyces coryli]
MAAENLRVAITGATGNVGTALVQALARDPAVGSIIGIARRRPEWSPPKTTWIQADIGTDRDAELADAFAGADAVVHLAWLIQPSRDPAVTWTTNVLGSLRVWGAAAAAGVPALVHASSVGAYSPGPKDRAVDESWPTHGWPQAAYCREKSYLERALDTFERDHPSMRVVRMRPGFIFRRHTAAQQRRLFAGPFLPGPLVRPGLIPVLPDVRGLVFQAVHGEDAAAAYRLAVLGDAAGAFNIAAPPVIDARLLAELLGARVVRVPRAAARAAAASAWRLRLTPAAPQLFDAVVRLPVMDTGRARDVLGWEPRHSGTDAVAEFLHGLRQGGAGAGLPTPPLDPHLPGGRLRELATGVGRRP